VLIVLDETDPVLLEATLGVVDRECAASAVPPVTLEDALVDRWLTHRNDVSALAPLWRGHIVVDTVEVSGRWSALSPLSKDVIGALEGIEGTLVASVHQSHAYTDGACLYFTFAGRSPTPDSPSLEWEEQYYRAAWDAATAAVQAHGVAISHHHGIGLNRSRFLPDALAESFAVFASLKDALDPSGILNPGKLGLPTAMGEVPWP
jgi:alkyldihydroxyacetonephosphate synthase